eukprot:1936553-Pyramimonas_sp.AAC.1
MTPVAQTLNLERSPPHTMRPKSKHRIPDAPSHPASPPGYEGSWTTSASWELVHSGLAFQDDSPAPALSLLSYTSQQVVVFLRTRIESEKLLIGSSGVVFTLINSTPVLL